jgi:hypothetical protein
MHYDDECLSASETIPPGKIIAPGFIPGKTSNLFTNKTVSTVSFVSEGENR